MGLNLNLLEDQGERSGSLERRSWPSGSMPGFSGYSWISGVRIAGIRYKYGMFKQQIRDGYQVKYRITG